MAAIRIIGIDPGLKRTGWGIVAAEGSRLVFVACGTIRTDEVLALPERLRQLHDGLTERMEAFAPDEAAVEETFANVNPQATLKLGQARGVALLVPALAGLPVAEYAANLVKKTVVGSGHADKRQIQAMVRILLPKADPETDDAADALAVAVTHAHHRRARTLARAAS